MTAPTYIHPDALKSQLYWISDKATRVCIVSGYARGDTFLEVEAKILCYMHISNGALFGIIWSQGGRNTVMERKTNTEIVDQDSLSGLEI